MSAKLYKLTIHRAQTPQKKAFSEESYFKHNSLQQ